MKELGRTFEHSDIKDALNAALKGAETHEEREKALISLIKDRDIDAKKCIEDLNTYFKARILVQNNLIFVITLAAIIGWAIVIF
jgi:hypothetical protein